VLPAGGMCCPRAADARERPRTYTRGDKLYADSTSTYLGTIGTTITSKETNICLTVGYMLNENYLHGRNKRTIVEGHDRTATAILTVSRISMRW